MEKNIYSIMDAFVALRDADDDIVMPTIKQKERVVEGKSFDIRSASEMEDAKDLLNAEEEETDIEVIDVDADTEEHLKTKEEYVGQLLVQCPICKATRFLNPDNVVASEEDPNVVNTDEECPHCGAQDRGFEIIGQVGQVNVEGPVVDNVEKTDEFTFDNSDAEADVEDDSSEEAEEAAPEADQAEEETEEEFKFDEIEEPEYDETSAEDDTVDMEDKTGDVVDQDEVEYDDTEEKPAEEPAEEKQETETEDEEETKKPKKVAKEALEDKEEERKVVLISDFVKDLPDADKVEKVVVRDLSKDAESEDAVLYEGALDEIPHEVLETEMKSFNNGQNGTVDILVSKEETDTPLAKALELIDKFAGVNIDLWDIDESDYAYAGKLDEFENADDYYFIAFETPKFVCFNVGDALEETEPELDAEEKEVLIKDDADDLVNEVFKANNLQPALVEVYGTVENAISETIKNKDEDLDYVFEHYVKGISEDLENKFASVTGYSNRTLEDRKLLSESLTGDEFKKLFDVATKCGYTKLEELDKIVKDNNLDWKDLAAYLEKNCKKDECLKEDLTLADLVSDDEETKDEKQEGDQEEGEGVEVTIEENLNEENFGQKFKDAVGVDEDLEVEDDDLEVEDDDEPEQDSDDKDDEDLDLEDDKVESFKNRAELSAAIKECRNNNIPYTVRKSLKEGYRYDLIKEDIHLDDIDLEDDEFVDAFDVEDQVQGDEDVDAEELAQVKEKLDDIAIRIASAVYNKYNKEIDYKFIAKDILNDMKRVMPDANFSQIMTALSHYTDAEIDRIVNSDSFKAQMAAHEVPGVNYDEEVEEDYSFLDEQFCYFMKDHLDEGFDLELVDFNVNEDKSITLNANLLHEDKKEHIDFTLTPILNENLDCEKAYSVTNSLSEEVFTFKVA